MYTLAPSFFTKVSCHFLWYVCHYLRSMEPKLEPAILTLSVTHIMKSSLWWDQQIHYNRPSVSNLLCLFPRHMSVHLFFSSIIGDVSRLWRGSSLCWNMTRTCQSSNIFRAVKESRSNCHGTKLMGGKETQNPEFICSAVWQGQLWPLILF